MCAVVANEVPCMMHRAIEAAVALPLVFAMRAGEPWIDRLDGYATRKRSAINCAPVPLAM
jgi:hypothetical protein